MLGNAGDVYLKPWLPSWEVASCVLLPQQEGNDDNRNFWIVEPRNVSNSFSRIR